MNPASPRVAIVIPARFASERLPGKPLADIAGKPMVQHVWEKAMSVQVPCRVLVAVDDPRVERAVREFGGEAIMTDPRHASGTDRLGEVMAKVPADLYLNLQGDEPLVRPTDIETLIAGMAGCPSAHAGTLCHAICAEEAADPNTVKVVLSADGDALYFSRSPIPYARDPAEKSARYLKHVGIYAYRQETLSLYSELPRPMIEKAEKLEQLRLLYAGYRIRVWEVAPTGPGVDTPECLEKVRAIFEEMRVG